LIFSITEIQALKQVSRSRSGRLCYLSHASAGGPRDTKLFALWLRRKYYQGKRLAFDKWFRFLPWSTQRRIGRLSRYVMMNHCGSIMAHGRELRIYRRPLICRAVRRTERIELAQRCSRSEESINLRVRKCHVLQMLQSLPRLFLHASNVVLSALLCYKRSVVAETNSSRGS